MQRFCKFLTLYNAVTLQFEPLKLEQVPVNFQQVFKKAIFRIPPITFESVRF